eukprot:TRINITY_DN4734_c0_g1_i1.p7 TRINITY_DN4734_c0_g1~~TRINITY_DN4734_c0_g1_i1.p7  ORF type:complete len:108 (-),score=3.51 TRINITY_DN4734_c0_g1_i1:834-1157(-)
MCLFLPLFGELFGLKQQWLHQDCFTLHMITDNFSTFFFFYVQCFLKKNVCDFLDENLHYYRFTSGFMQEMSGKFFRECLSISSIFTLPFLFSHVPFGTYSLYVFYTR